MRFKKPKNSPFYVHCYQCKHYVFEKQVGCAYIGRCEAIKTDVTETDAYSKPCGLFRERKSGDNMAEMTLRQAMSMDKLKKCPFCGGNARFGVNYDDQWGVFCKECSAVVWGTTKEGAINAWNRRASDHIAELITRTIPTVDAVEVVRCKDCKHCEYPVPNITKHGCRLFDRCVKADWFCADAERR